MDAVQALADLTGVSSQIDAAVLLGDDGTVLAATVPDAAAARVAEAGTALVDAAASDAGRAALTDVVVTLDDGAIVCSRFGGRTIVAVTVPDPTIGLVLYDLRSTLRAAKPKPKPKAKPRAKPKPRKKATDA